MSLADNLLRAGRAAALSWREVPVAERVQRCKQLEQILAERSEALVDVICRETSKPRLDALTGDVLVTLEVLRYYIRHAEALLSPEARSAGSLLYAGSKTYVEYAPFGVVLILGPWNYPFQLTAVPTLTALLAGNAVVLKPSETTPQTAQMWLECLEAAGFPRGLLQLALGDGSLGSDLVAAGPDKIFVTGSAQTGRKVLAKAAEKLIPVTLELGGKDAMLVLEDAPLERVVQGALYGAFANAGQVCVSVKKIFVAERQFESFKKAFVAACAKLNIGAGAHVDYGPMARDAELKTILAQVEEAVALGAHLETPLHHSERLLHPLVLSRVPPDCALYREESFGPVVILESFSEVDEAIEKINASALALGASVWTSDLVRARAIASRLQVGTVDINDVIKNIGKPGAPFGGNKDSGFGRYRGPEGLRTFSRQKTVHVSSSKTKPERNWFPNTAATYTLIQKFMKLRYLSFWGRFFLACCLAPSAHGDASLGQLKVKVESVLNAEGKMAYALFNSKEGFPSKKELSLSRAFVEIPQDLDLRLEFKDLLPGEYALSLYHDLNGNEKLDKSFLGIPKEPIGHSNNPKIFMGPPRFQSASFQVLPGTNEIVIRMLR